jgi:hypothetical protein
MDPTIISNLLNIYIHKITNKMVNHRINIFDQYIYTIRSIKKRHWLRLPGLGNNSEKLGLPERLCAGIQEAFSRKNIR